MPTAYTNPNAPSLPIEREPNEKNVSNKDFTEAAGTNYRPPESSTPPSGKSSSGQFVGDLRSLRDLIRRSAHGQELPIVKDYRLLEEIGYGGFGVVWKAQHLESFDRERDEDFSAIKFFRREGPDTTMILKEVQNMKAVQGSTGIVPVHDISPNGLEPHGIPHYVMHFAKNGSLQNRIEETREDESGKVVRFRKTIPPNEATDLLLRIAKSLKFVHEHNMVHSDLKPANILVNEAGEPLIADFGQSQRGSVSDGQGTLFFMAPERASIEDQKPDARWDVFSFGALAYSLLVGRPPWWTEERSKQINESTTKKNKFDRYRNELYKSPQPAEHRAVCDPELARIIDRCLSPAPALRPKDGGELVQLLENRLRTRRQKPILKLAAFITFGALTLSAVASLFAGNYWVGTLESAAISEVKTTLAQQAFLGKSIVEEKLSDRVGFVEYHARETSRCSREFRSMLAGIGDKIKEGHSTPNPLKHITKQEFEIADTWLETIIYPVLARRHPGDRKKLALFVVVNHTPLDKSGYIVSRMTGQWDPEKKRDEIILFPKHDRMTADELERDPDLVGKKMPTANPDNYLKNWSFRDYFNGEKNDFEHQKSTHDVVRTTHISHLYRSKAKEKIKDREGKEIEYFPWQIDVASPIWEIPDFVKDGKIMHGLEIKDNRVVGLLVCGLDVGADLEKALGTNSASSNIQTLLINDRMSWSWHNSTVRDSFSKTSRDPEVFENARIENFIEGTAASESTLEDEHFRDPVKVKYQESSNSNERHSHFARGERLEPYRYSVDQSLRKKSWVFLAEVERNHALAKVNEIRNTLCWWGTAVFAIATTVIAGLWFWLIRLLRRVEFAKHA